MNTTPPPVSAGTRSAAAHVAALANEPHDTPESNALTPETGPGIDLQAEQAVTSDRLNWLRAGVLGANDGIVSTAGLVLGVAGASPTFTALLTAGVAGLVSGALSMAAGEYVSVSTQRDTEKAAIRSERAALAELPHRELDELAALLRGELRRTGMVLSDPEVLTAMEHSALESPCYLPIAVKKDGSVSGLAASVLADAAQMGKMGRYVDELLRKVARELGDGNIDADPCRRGPQESACDWCPFASACWFDEKRDKPHYLQKTTPEEFWQLVDEEVTRRG